MPAKCRVAGCMTVLLLCMLVSAGIASGQQPQFQMPRPQPKPPAEQPAAPPATVPTQVTKLVVFSIPFEPPVTRYPRAVEVQLYVSDDAGQNWRLHSQTEPGRGKFTFRAPRDGEYWFAVRTRDEADKLHPPGRATPEMRVVVDTVAPEVALNAWRGAAGEIRVRWQINEPLLRPDSLKLWYGAPGSEAWQPVAINPLDLRSHTTSHIGEAVFWPAAGTETLAVRAQVTDAAGNLSQTEAPIGSDTPPGTAPLAATAPTNVAAQSTAPPQGSPGQPAADGAYSQTALRPGATPQAAPVATPWRSVESTGGQPRPDVPTTQQGAGSGATEAATEATTEKAVVATEAPSAAAPQVAENTSPTAVASAPNPAVAQQVVAEQEPTATEPVSPLFAMLPAGQRPRMVNSTRFELEYDLESIQKEDVARVELWGTANGGKDWGLCSETPGYQSPLVVQVAGAGLYGFRIVLIDQVGNGAGRPTGGDEPDVWVAVDLEAPQLQLLGVDLVPEAPNSLRITWQAQDDQLAAKPVSISFATQPAGPWTSLATGLPNSGEYLWQLEQRTPGQIYVQVEVQDSAGNKTAAVSAEPVRTAQARPAGRVLDVRPVPQQ